MSKPHTPFETILSFIHPSSPYEGFDLAQYELDGDGWNSDSPVFERLIEETRPTLIIEVGSWKGASAIHMASLLKKHKIAGAILCIDTWLGSVSHRQMYPEELRLQHGYPRLYFQFLANVIHSGHDDTIIPFPQTSLQAGHWLGQINLNAGLIYLDGAHEDYWVYAEAKQYWDLTAPGGVLFGDDYGEGWSGEVEVAVDRFSAEIGMQPEIFENKWMLRKPEV